MVEVAVTVSPLSAIGKTASKAKLPAASVVPEIVPNESRPSTKSRGRTTEHTGSR